jgi:pyridoxine 5-phosphate synthase
VRLLKETVNVRLNLEMSAAEEIVQIACQTKPHEATLVPERRQEVTTEGGLDVVAHEKLLRDVIRRLKEQAIIVSLFVDPDLRQIETARLLGADAVELQTARYSEAKTPAAVAEELDSLAQSALFAKEHGLHVHMGHGLNYINVIPVAAIPQVEELNIGHSIVSRALFVGLREAVREMKNVIRAARK